MLEDKGDRKWKHESRRDRRMDEFGKKRDVGGGLHHSKSESLRETWKNRETNGRGQNRIRSISIRGRNKRVGLIGD